MRGVRPLVLIAVAALLACAGAPNASAIEPGQFYLGPCGAASESRAGWEFGGNVAWSVASSGCDVWLEQAPIDVFGIGGPATATLMLGPGRIDELHLHLGGSDGLARGVSQTVSVCGPGGWPSDCGAAISVAGTSSPAGQVFDFEAGDEELPADADRLVMAATCLLEQCSPGSPLKVFSVDARMTDSSPPEVEVTAPEGWLNSSSTLAVQASDPDSGIDYVRFATPWESRRSPICGDAIADPPNADNAWSCPVGIYADLPLPKPLLFEGVNNLSVEVHNGADLGTAKTLPVRYDSSPPSAPAALDYGQSDRGWAIGTDLTLRWENPGESVETRFQSGVAEARLVVDPLTFGGVPVTVSSTGDGVAALPFQLRDYGVHDAHLTLIDRAGNVRTKDFEIRNDRPEVSPPVASGYMPVNAGMAGSGVKFSWAAGEPLSRLCGFRVELNTDPATDFGGIDPNRPVTTTSSSWTLTPSGLSQLSDGLHFLHLQSVACSDAVSPMVHAQVLIDRIPPVVEMFPAPKNGWLTNGGLVTLRTIDPGSDRSTLLRYRVGNVHRTSTLKDTSVSLPPDANQLAWSAVDFAGNESTETVLAVGVDNGPPAIAIDPMSPADPTRVHATVVDADSGVVSARIDLVDKASSGRIQLAKFDSSTGTTGPVDLHASIPDDGTLSDGDYELEASARDAAGRESTQTLFSDQTPADLRLPLRPRSNLTAGTALRVGGAAPKQRFLDYGARSILVGTLRDASGAPIPGAELSVVADYEGGGLRRIGQATTRGDGSYELALGPDTSRELVIRFAGDPSHAAARTSVYQDFRAGITLSARRISGGFLLKGTVRRGSASYPRGGLEVRIELCVPRRCTEYSVNAKTDSDGNFAKPWYGSKLGRRSIYRFRARVNKAPGWPYADGVSKTVKIKRRSK